ncbi:MAG TPA: hypothetical protein VFR41_13115, partial [Acidimicrobiia bacterium]|nr:hypothetical protein [Acidimicrobiia bacterium]
GMVSTVPDLLTWGRALWRDGKVLQPATLTEAEHFTQYGTGLGMLAFSRRSRAFCVFIGCRGNAVAFDGPGGSGEFPGARTTVMYDPQLDTVVSVAVTSSVQANAELLTGAILDVVARAR